MNGSVRKAFLVALGEEVKERTGVTDLVEVVNFEQETVSTGYCDTCYDEYQVLRVDYVTKSGERKSATISDSLADLLNALLRG